MESAYGDALAELAGIRRRLEEGRLELGEVEKLVIRAKQSARRPYGRVSHAASPPSGIQP